MPRTPKTPDEITLYHGFDAVKVLNNANVYAVLLSLAMLNIFKEGMWMKILPPYTLFLAMERIQDDMTFSYNLSPTGIVGATLSLYGITRAIVSVVAGVLINRLGADSVLVMTGWFGLLGIIINCCCLWRRSIEAVFFLNFVWGVFDGLWGQCLEVIWARSIVMEKREDVNWARQVLNMGTKALGPVIALIFFLVHGNKWRIPDMRDAMLCGTLLSTLPVMTCFLFHHQHEVRQEVKLCDISYLSFSDADVDFKELKKDDFDKVELKEAGPIKISYPLSGKSKYGKLRILTPDLQESSLILGKQYRARFRNVSATDTICMVHFEDPSRDSLQVDLESVSIFLSPDYSVNTTVSSMVFNLYPDLLERENGSDSTLIGQATSRLFAKSQERIFGSDRPGSDRLARLFSGERQPMQERLLSGLSVGSYMPGQISLRGWNRSWREEGPSSDGNGNGPSSFEQPKLTMQDRAMSTDSRVSSASTYECFSPPSGGGETIMERKLRKRWQKSYRPNIFAANVILFCDMLNALGAGFSLRFIDLFLIQEYELSPAEVLFITFLECCCGFFLITPAHRLIFKVRERGYHAKTGVLLFWGLSLFFLGILCVPGMPLAAIVPAVVLLTSLNACTKAYLRAKLVSYLPHDRVANYMVWESLNKGTQGGITMCGAMVIQHGHYQSCFLCSFGIMFIRFVLYGAYTARRVTRGKIDSCSQSDLWEEDIIRMHLDDEDDKDIADLAAEGHDDANFMSALERTKKFPLDVETHTDTGDQPAMTHRLSSGSTSSRRKDGRRVLFDPVPQYNEFATGTAASQDTANLPRLPPLPVDSSFRTGRTPINASS